MTKNLLGAMEEEKRYLAERMQGIDSSLQARLSSFGYKVLDNYFVEKKDYLFSQWTPEVRRTDISIVADEVEQAIKNKDYGVYIPTVSGLYAFYGSEELDFDLCKSLNVRPVNMGYSGGTIVGSSEDFAIEILMPASIGIDGHDIISKFAEIISTKIEGVTIDGNDILVDGAKVMGSMERHFGHVYVWAAQVSFADYTDYITKLCKKSSVKCPSKIDTNLLSREQLEKEVLAWLQKH